MTVDLGQDAGTIHHPRREGVGQADLIQGTGEGPVPHQGRQVRYLQVFPPHSPRGILLTHPPETSEAGLLNIPARFASGRR